MTWAATRTRASACPAGDFHGIIRPMPIRRLLPVAAVGEIAPGTARSFRFGVRQGIAYNDGGTVKAYVNACPHMAGQVDLKANGIFQCRWHEATFDPATGKRLAGQAPEGTCLPPITLEEKDGRLFAVLEIADEIF